MVPGWAHSREALGVEDGDSITSRLDRSFVAELAEDPDDDFAHRPDGISQLLLADWGEKLAWTLMLRCEVQQVTGDPLSNVAEGVA